MKKREEKFKIRKPILLLFSITIIFVITTLYISTGIFWKKELLVKSNQKNKELLELFDVKIASETIKIDGLIHFIESNKELQKIWMKKNRKDLIKSCEEIFSNIKEKYDITHFYFHQKDKVNFIRIHNPEKYGDIITRFTMEEAYKTGEISSGIELGPLGTFTLRVVKPWIINGKLEGYIELGEEIENLTSEIAHIINLDLIFFIDKEHLIRENWENGLKVLNRSGDWDQFDNVAIISSSIKNIPEYMIDALTSISPYDKSQIVEHHREEQFEIHSDKNSLFTTMTPLTDVSGKEVGATLVLYSLTDDMTSINDLRLKVIILFLIIGSIIFLISYKLLGEMDHKYSVIRQDLLESVKESNKSNEKLNEVNQDLQDFMYIASHDLQSPLVSMSGFAGIFIESISDKLTDEELFPIKRIEANSKKMQDLIKSLLDVSRLNTVKKEFVELNLNEVLDNIISTLDVNIAEKNVNIVRKELPNMHGDKIRLETLARNIISNAIKYGAKNIEIGFDYSKNYFYIKDDGVGIDPEQLENVFKPGSRLQIVKNEGVGMGLSFCKKVVELHNGKIWAESEGKDKGTMLCMKFTK
ncbi:MAG: ATP-binding protein [Candidatus Delongbacteria bacterium]|nr:ATP-binding protein [Candidatus Delongbacteria bacterium]